MFRFRHLIALPTLAVLMISISSHPLSAGPDIEDVAVVSGSGVGSVEGYDHEKVSELMRRYDSLLKDIQSYSKQSKELREQAKKTVDDAKRRSANARAVTNGLLLLGTVAAATTAEGLGDSYLAEEIVVDGLLTTAAVDGAMRHTGDRNVDKALDKANTTMREAVGIEQELMRWKRELNDLESQMNSQTKRVLKRVNAVVHQIDGFEKTFGSIQDIAFGEEGEIVALTVSVQKQKVDITLAQLDVYIKDDLNSLVKMRQEEHSKAVDIAKKAQTDQLAAQAEIDSWDDGVTRWQKMNSIVPWSKNNTRYKKVKSLRFKSSQLEETTVQSANKVRHTKSLLDRSVHAQKMIQQLDKDQVRTALKSLRAL